MAIALGLVLVGGLIPQMVGITFGLEFTQGELVVSVQELINGLIPGVIPMLLTLLMCYLVRKGEEPRLPDRGHAGCSHRAHRAGRAHHGLVIRVQCGASKI